MFVSYSYDQIKRIKEELLELNNTFMFSQDQEVKNSLKEINVRLSEYDKILNEIGPDGTVSDRELIRGFQEVEILIQNIKRQNKINKIFRK